MAGFLQEHPPRPAPGGGLLPKGDALLPDGEVSGPCRGGWGGWRRSPGRSPCRWAACVLSAPRPAVGGVAGPSQRCYAVNQREEEARPGAGVGRLEIRCVTVHDESRHHHRPGIQLMWQPPASLTEITPKPFSFRAGCVLQSLVQSIQ